VFIVKSAARKLKDKKYKNLQLFISDDLSKTVCKEQAKLRRNYLPAVKARRNVKFAFIPWSVPAQIFYKEDSTEKLKSFMLPKEQFKALVLYRFENLVLFVYFESEPRSVCI